ncbi:MAG: tRNA 2-thiouridine(34) synthase MnmA [Candidatus Zambryskibacteria bacterium CG22_combo_CG10-13_8_21_14_all_42_17]|uniref:tRNA-specific 2-thiouridylase MnmA n=1 Tax=Candidatus Zambryskibacteria bacterium CG22_combo_CG10-13_8_21_14_all_42_17 TaxID=1975118 RepID=A0A2H0BFE7_9BACT|nr:MAG: tRNA 2-thiouridine(34) synthase MnmA [Candidatus Zambryskibacteria bacterium CG22_combo_CG10-13_8_21_14_all_42_17]
MVPCIILVPLMNMWLKNINILQDKIVNTRSLRELTLKTFGVGVNLFAGSASKKPKVFVGLSGGVDSAVSAAILKQRGFDVTGVFIKVWQPDFLPCTWRDERRDAMRVSIALDIPFLFLDFEEEYKKGVVDKMIAEYKAGRTPNPDVLCNKEIKFGSFWKKAKEMGADYIATGHYARIEREFTISNSQFSINESISNENLNIENSMKIENFKLKIGIDSEKDQSYFLWTLAQDDLSHILFPIGNLKKEEVRRLARQYGLPVSEKKDSQGICFIGNIRMDEFLAHFIQTKPGKVLDTVGHEIGTHDGAVLYTVGERHGFTISQKGPEDKAFYVLSKDIMLNTLVVSNKKSEIISHSPTKIEIKNVNWITEPVDHALFARIRYRGEKIPVKLFLANHRLAVEFKKPVRGLSLGQSIVFYLSLNANEEKSIDESDICLGGAVMDRIIS